MTPLFPCQHPRTPENSAPNGASGDICRTCRNARKRRNYAADIELSRVAGRDRMRQHRGGLKGNANARKTHCTGDHAYTPENTYYTPDGGRQCKTCRPGLAAESYQRHRERRTAEMRTRYAADPAKHRAGEQAWRENNREYSNQLSQIKKARCRAAGELTLDDWLNVLDEYGAACLACGSDAPPTIDHVVPVIRGGANTRDNVQPLCCPCNSRKGTKTVDYRPHAAVAV